MFPTWEEALIIQNMVHIKFGKSITFLLPDNQKTLKTRENCLIFIYWLEESEKYKNNKEPMGNSSKCG